MTLQKLLVYGNHPLLLNSILQEEGKWASESSDFIVHCKGENGTKTLPKDTGMVLLLHAPPVSNAVAQIRDWKEINPDLPIVVVTPDDSFEETRGLFKAGASDVFQLPLTYCDIQDFISNYLKSADGQGYLNFNTVGDSSATTLDANFFGNFRININGESPGLANKSKQILGLLMAHHPNPIPREHLIKTFWADKFSNSPESARCSLNVEITKIRNEVKKIANLDGDIVMREGNTYYLNKSLIVKTDLDLYKNLFSEISRELHSNATVSDKQIMDFIQSYKGRFMDDCDVSQHDMLLMERQHYSSMFEYLIDIYCTSLVQNNMDSLANEICLSALESEPTLELLHRRVMEYYYGKGLCQKAIQQFQLCKRFMEYKIGTSISAETQRLYEEIMDGCKN